MRGAAGSAALAFETLEHLEHLAPRRGIADRGHAPLERLQFGVVGAIVLIEHPRRPHQAAAHRRHVDVEEHAVAVEPEPARPRRPVHEQQVRRDRLHADAHPLRADEHRLLEHAFHRRDLESRLHLLGPLAGRRPAPAPAPKPRAPAVTASNGGSHDDTLHGLSSCHSGYRRCETRSR